MFFDLQVATVHHDIELKLKNVKNNILEIGCGFQPYRHLIPAGVKYYAIDWEGARTNFQYEKEDTVYYDGNVFPVQSGTFGFVFHAEVLEHIYDIKRFLSECNRVLSIKGRMLFTVPFSARYHYIPHDYWRVTPACINKLLKEAGFKNIVISIRGDDIVVILSKINAVLYRIIFKKYSNIVLNVIIKILFIALFGIPILFFTITAHVALILKVGSSDDPLGYTVECEK